MPAQISRVFALVVFAASVCFAASVPKIEKIYQRGETAYYGVRDFYKPDLHLIVSGHSPSGRCDSHFDVFRKSNDSGLSVSGYCGNDSLPSCKEWFKDPDLYEAIISYMDAHYTE